MSSELPPFAISVRQPWAWAIIHAGKDVENRVKRAITMGGMDKHPRLAIHAASGMTRDEYERAREFMLTLMIVPPRPDELVRGGIIGAVTIKGITHDSPSKWFFGPWALMLFDAVPVDPLACAGQLGAFEWRPGISEALRDPLPWMKSWPGRARGAAMAPAARLL